MISMTGRPPQEGQDLVIESGRIAEILPTADHPRPSEVIDASGLFAIPGLWDMHTHLSAWGDAGRDVGFRLLIANGVTGVRDLGGFPGFLPRWRREIAAGLVGPQLLFAGQAFSGPGVPWDSHVAIGSEAEAREAVRHMESIGADFIKVHRGVPAVFYPTVVEEAQTLGLPVVGHVPRALTAAYVSSAGQKSIEHMFGIVGWFDDYFDPDSIAGPEQRVTRDKRKLFELLRQNETWVTPTTNILLKIMEAQNESLDRRPRRRYAPHSLHEIWDRERLEIRPDVSAEDRRRYVDYELAVLYEMHRTGVRILAGSDTGGFDAAPGFELHDELRMLVRAGFTPLEALQCATVNPAEFLGLLDSRGTLGVGKVADIVLLSGNPLHAIENLDRIEGVVLGGEIYRREDLDVLLADAESIAREL